MKYCKKITTLADIASKFEFSIGGLNMLLHRFKLQLKNDRQLQEVVAKTEEKCKNVDDPVLLLFYPEDPEIPGGIVTSGLAWAQLELPAYQQEYSSRHTTGITYKNDYLSNVEDYIAFFEYIIDAYIPPTS